MKNKISLHCSNSYFLTIMLLYSTIHSVKSQVVYVDIPDFISGQTGIYSLDLNNDFDMDFQIKKIHSTTTDTIIVDGSVMNNNEVAVDPSQSFYATSFPANASIDAILIWQQNVVNIASYSNGSPGPGFWLGATDKYLPLKFTISGQYHYGWARMDVTSNASSFTLKDYAYNSTPNASILAGEGQVTGIFSSEDKNVLIYSYNHSLYVDIQKQNENIVINIFNSIGQQVNKVNATTGITVIDVPESGCYFVIANNTGILSSRKVFIK